ncbi:hypothetical protein PHYSODRAFT_249856 [Phytophthora sojae]|uniref:Uncharacterized protein n=1 Tax=Phytophthora sojae (strain P6497) TaxID=1094619 RepID=G5A554_PHYSP|nr:hypothetical protein PHYSODRAFT_249856 [Phytophthora sojae]EGZ09239.1 hypothetical protein PHYSODRAFT_249856 [Phytophthora sojae]|eukprot:XP_009535872.1 hypothetical protein PHYSODRAFT_249856 [Phytophthora sojae]
MYMPLQKSKSCSSKEAPHATQRRPEIVTTTASAERGSCTVPPPPRTRPTDPGHDVSRGAPVGAGWSTSSVCYCRALPIDAKTVCVLTMGSDEVVVREGNCIGDSGVSGEMIKSEQELEKAVRTSCTMPPKIVSMMTLVTVNKIGGEPTKDKKMEAKAAAVVNVPREGQRPVMTSLVGPFEAGEVE